MSLFDDLFDDDVANSGRVLKKNGKPVIERQVAQSGLSQDGASQENVSQENMAESMTLTAAPQMGGYAADDLFAGVNTFAAPSFDVDKLWQLCLDELKLQVGEKDYHQWLRPLRPVIEGEYLVILAINLVFIRHVNTHYLGIINRVLAEHTGGKLTAVVRVQSLAPEPAPKPKKRSTNKKTPLVFEESEAIEEQFTFENFVKAKSNALAYSTLYELAKRVGEKGNIGGNLFFIHGASGLGKTHLMQAVAHRYQKSGLSYCYFSKDRFFRVSIEAMRGGEEKTEQFIKKISRADLLIIDDVHMINNKNGPKVSQLMLTLFEEFTKGSKRLILASDKPPLQMKDFDSRFLSRFSGGLEVAVSQPDIETRVQILQKKAHALNMELPKECALFIAQNVAPDVRRLEGALLQLKAYSLTRGINHIDLYFVQDALQDRMESKTRLLNAETVRDVVAEYYSVSAKDLIGKKRVRTIARPRQMAMALVRELTQDSLLDIGHAFGGRDHTTVMHACETIAKLRQEDDNINTDYQNLLTTLKFS